MNDKEISPYRLVIDGTQVSEAQRLKLMVEIEHEDEYAPALSPHNRIQAVSPETASAAGQEVSSKVTEPDTHSAATGSVQGLAAEAVLS